MFATGISNDGDGVSAPIPIRRGLSLVGSTGDPDSGPGPNANAYAERVIETVRAECLDWSLILGRGHVDRTLRTYATRYNRSRPHRALALA